MKARNRNGAAIQAERFVAAYQQALSKAYCNGNSDGFDDIPFIGAFLQAATGYGDNLPTHYPRLRETPDPGGKNFRWFVANKASDGQKYALGPLQDDPGLPYNPKR